MKKKLLSILLVASATCFVLTNPLSAFAEENTNEESENPYVEKFLDETPSETAPDEDFVVNPEEEKNIIIDELEEYYASDLEAAAILENYYSDSDITNKATSLDPELISSTLNLISNIYWDTTSEEQEILLDYLYRYSNNLEHTETIKLIEKIETLKSNTNQKFSIAAASTYNASAAATWAFNNYNKYNSGFPAFKKYGSDCANFVSQAMHLGGGKKMDSKWYVKKKNSKYLVPTSAKELNYSFDLADPSPWISAKQFYKYWKSTSRSTSYNYSHDKYIKDHKTIYKNTPIVKGDVVVFQKGVASVLTIPTHVMIISSYDTVNKDFKLAGHSNERQAYALKSAISSYSQIGILHIK